MNIKESDEKLDFSNTLNKASFDEDDIKLLMDLSTYMISQESAGSQWFRRYNLYSLTLGRDNFIYSFIHSFDSVDKFYQKFKSFLGMNKYEVFSEESMHCRILIWFTASNLKSRISCNIKELREKSNNKKLLTQLYLKTKSLKI